MRRKSFALILGVFLTLAVSSGFSALNTVPDKNNHPAFGAICIQMSDGDPWACYPGGGFLVAPNVVISVAHACPWLEAVQPAHKGFTFDEKVGSPSKVYEIDQWICDPQFAWNPQDPHDLAVVTLKESITNIRPISLPPIIDFIEKGNIAGHAYVTIVTRSLTTLTGWPDFPAWGDRQNGTAAIFEVQPTWLMVSPNEKHVAQGCYGDSGSVALLTNTNIALGIGAFFNAWTGECQGPTGYNRLDTTEAREFFGNYLSPELLPK